METTIDLKQVHKEKFKSDPVFKAISDRGLMEMLFNDEHYFSAINLQGSFSTKRAAAILGETNKEYKLTNLLAREKLRDYFQVFRKNDKSHYRYTWDSIFRFKMIFTLMDQANLTPSDIDDIVNEPTLVRKEQAKPSPNPYDVSEATYNNQLDSVSVNEQFIEVLQQRTMLHTEKYHYKSKLDHLTARIEDKESRLRYYELMLIKEKGIAASQKNDKGFLSKLFSKQEPIVDKTEEELLTKETNAEIEKLAEEITAAKEEKNEVRQTYDDLTQKLLLVERALESKFSERLSKVRELNYMDILKLEKGETINDNT